MKKLAMVPGPKMINGLNVDSVEHIENKGVIIKDRFGKVIAFIKEQCNDKAEHYTIEISKFVMACADKQNYEMNFNLPAKKQATSK